MSTEFPQHLDPWRASAAQQNISARVALAQLRRLHDKLEMSALKEDMGIQFSAEFSRDDRGRPLIHLSVQGAVPLRCQRSLRTYLQEVVAESWVVIVRDEAEAERVSEEHEPVLLSERSLALRDLVEEEVLLALPLVPIDPQCPATSVDAEADAAAVESQSESDAPAQKRNPFAALAGLKESQAGGKKKIQGKRKKPN